MPRSVVLPLCLLLCLAGGVGARAQDQTFVSDDIFIVLHSGPGVQYRWLGRLTAGTALTRTATEAQEGWVEVTTERGTTGWVQREFLSGRTPMAVQMAELQAALERERARVSELEAGLGGDARAVLELREQLASAEQALVSARDELVQVKSVAGRELQLDTDNTRLVAAVEALRTELDTLQVDNQRLQDSLQSSAFIDGALAVLLGVIITLVVPRLWPQRRRSSGWA